MFVGIGLVFLTAVAPPTSKVGQTPTYVFVNVNVVPMDRERVLTNQTVVVQGDKIIAMGTTGDVKVPDGAVRIEGNGGYLIPGLAEMHAHIPGGQTADSVIERVLGLFVVNGVTTIRGMAGHPRHLGYRARAANNEILSPTIYTSGGPTFSGGSVPTDSVAERLVIEQKKAGVDILKIHPGIKRDVFEKLAATAKAQNIRFGGHVPLDLGIERALELKYWTVDHLDGFVEGYVPEKRPFTTQESGFFGLGLIDRVDESRIKVLAKKAKANDVWMVPTETLMQHLTDNYTADELKNRPEMKYWSKADVNQWANRSVQAQAQPEAQRLKYAALRRKMIKQMHDEGVKFLLGSDAPQVWNVPGFSVYRELALLVAAGLTPYQALATGTRNVAEHFGTLDKTGTIAKGKQADLVLLQANPLTGIKGTERPAGVMVRGRWLDKAEIERRLEEYAAK